MMMKFQITMKDPDGVYDCMKDAAKEAAEQVTGVDEDEREGLVETKMEKIQKLAKQWFEYGEYLTVEIDTEAKTCVVVPRK
jgi:nitrogen regulatory protein PII-like uncharacterized protein